MELNLTDRDKVDALIEEYKQLKREIEEWSRVRNWFISITLTATGAIFSYGFSTNNPYIFFMALLIQIPCLSICLSAQSSIAIISEYIQLKIEQKIPTLKWETMITKYYTNMKNVPIEMFHYGIYGIIIFSIFSSFLLSAIYWPWKDKSDEWNVTKILIFGFLLLFVVWYIVCFVRKYKRGSQLRQEIRKKWCSLIDNDVRITTDEK